jgi:SUMO ligase MMS21 Smc5/6 complex component
MIIFFFPMSKIGQTISEYKEIQLENIDNVILTLLQTAVDLETSLAEVEEEETFTSDQSLQQLDKTLKELIDLKQKTIIEMEVLKDIQPKVLHGEISNEDCAKMFDREVRQKIQAFDFSEKAKEKNNEYIEFRTSIFQVRNPTKIFRFNDEEGSDDDMIVVGGTIQTKCPITQAIMYQPYTAPCKHSFSEAIFEMVTKGYGNIRCPVPGCNGQIQATTLKKNTLLGNKIERAVRAEEEENERREVEDLE